MLYDSFKNYIRNSFTELMGPDVPIQIHSVLKNNNVHLDALTILPKGESISPSIYLNDYYSRYQNGASLNSIIREITEVYETSRNQFRINTDDIMNFNCARNLVAYKLINYDANSELLKTIPHIRYLDLAIIFYLLLERNGYAGATAIITNEHMEMWQTDTDTLYALAVYNTPRMLDISFTTLESMMREMIMEDLRYHASFYKELEKISDEGMLTEETISLMADDIMDQYTADSGQSDMFVLTNTSRSNGAAVILYENALVQAADRIGSSFYILPSSIHEMILLPAKEDDPFTVENLEEMVREINLHDVAATEKLSDTIYFYDAESRTVSMLV
ncbi:MAG: DUF5688 family protein [Lachnospiraceae bacterium]|nr:DUF5688 family protein [Lachnospiraceae bacterium]